MHIKTFLKYNDLSAHTHIHNTHKINIYSHFADIILPIDFMFTKVMSSLNDILSNTAQLFNIVIETFFCNYKQTHQSSNMNVF